MINLHIYNNKAKWEMFDMYKQLIFSLRFSRLWVILVYGYYQFDYIKAAPPCNKGEINIPLGLCSIVLGWQNKD